MAGNKLETTLPRGPTSTQASTHRLQSHSAGQAAGALTQPSPGSPAGVGLSAAGDLPSPPAPASPLGRSIWIPSRNHMVGTECRLGTPRFTVDTEGCLLGVSRSVQAELLFQTPNSYQRLDLLAIQPFVLKHEVFSTSC